MLEWITQTVISKHQVAALPGLSNDFGLENWGLAFAGEDSVLCADADGASGVRDRERAAQLVARLLAHQWVGNMLKTQWWNELWLKEGGIRFSTAKVYCILLHYSVGAQFTSFLKLLTRKAVSDIFQVGPPTLPTSVCCPPTASAISTWSWSRTSGKRWRKTRTKERNQSVQRSGNANIKYNNGHCLRAHNKRSEAFTEQFFFLFRTVKGKSKKKSAHNSKLNLFLSLGDQPSLWFPLPPVDDDQGQRHLPDDWVRCYSNSVQGGHQTNDEVSREGEEV